MAGVGLVLAGAVLVGLGQWWLRVPGIEPPALPYAFELDASQSTTPTTGASPASSSPEDGANAGIVQPTPSAAPERMSVSIPALALKARIVPASSFEQVGALRSLSIPSDASAAAWFSRGGTVANLGRGTTLVAGHVVNDGRRGAFFSLSLAKPGMLVYTTDADGRRREWSVAGSRQTPKAPFPADFWSGEGPARLVLVTCGGRVLPDGHFEDNIIVTAVPTGRLEPGAATVGA